MTKKVEKTPSALCDWCEKELRPGDILVSFSKNEGPIEADKDQDSITMEMTDSTIYLTLCTDCSQLVDEDFLFEFLHEHLRNKLHSYPADENEFSDDDEWDDEWDDEEDEDDEESDLEDDDGDDESDDGDAVHH